MYRREGGGLSKGLTLRQSEILDFISCYINKNKYPPSIKEIGEYFNISSKGSYDHVRALQKKKYLSFEAKKSRSIKVLVFSNENEDGENLQEIPILGIVQAGLPVFSEENIEGKIKIAKEMFGVGKMFGLRIRGDSMIGVGINEGDIAIIKSMNLFENGEVVVMDTGNGVTIKKAYREKNSLRLEAANERYSPIYTRNARMIGKLVGLIRKY